MNRSIPVLVATTAVLLPATTLLSPQVHAAGKSATTAKTVKFTGPSVNMKWGPVQVTIVVKGKKIVNITATAPTERPRSAYINHIAVPMLVQEVLKAQSSKIYAVSGATMTSNAFYTSLLPALKAAKLA